jgi:NADH-quinone oxidoreductase subunit L
VLWGIAALTALLTAIYMTRMMVMTFKGEERFGNDHSSHGQGHDDHHGDHGKPHESPPVMWVPLAVLAVLSTIGGLVGIPAALGGSNHFEHFLAPSIARVQTHSRDVAHGPARIEVAGAAQATTTPAVQTEEPHNVGLEFGLMGLSLALAIAGIFIGRAIFLKTPLKPMPTVLENKYYVDELYDATIVNPIENTSRSFLWKFIDVKLIDGFVNGVAITFAGLAGILRTTQTGLARSYAAVILLGAVIVIGYFASTLLR